MVYSCSSFIAVSPSQIQITLSQISSSRNLVRTSVFTRLFQWQYIVCSLKVIYHVLEELFVCQSVIPCLLIRIVLVNLFINPRHLTENGKQLIIEVTAQEPYFCHPLTSRFFTQYGNAILFQSNQHTVTTRHGTEQTVPQFIHFARSSRGQCSPNIESMIARIIRSGTTFQAIVRSNVTIRKQIERISVPTIAQHSISSIDHRFRLRESLVFIHHSGRIVIQEIVTACESHS